MEQFWGLVRRQMGVVSRDQARECGITDSQMAWWVRTDMFERVYPRVFRHLAAHRSRAQLLVATSLWLAARGALASVTAAAAHGLDRLPDEDIIRARVPGGGRSPHDGLVIVRGNLPEGHVAEKGLLRVTDPAWTITDLAADVGRARFRAAAESALRRRLCSSRQVIDVMIDRGPTGWKGRRAVREWLEWRGEGPAIQFELEITVFDLLKRHGAEPPSRQHIVAVDGVPYTLDFAWPQARVAVECDGFDAHGGRDHFDVDRIKIAAITSVGWRVLPVTWTEATRHTDRFVRRVRSLIGRAA